jgi:iron-sulfur cluster repair protein YtfE (RIC family)
VGIRRSAVEKYANKGIKDIILEFPRIGQILEEYGIGCGPCIIGICQLKDILQIHKLSKEAEEALMRRIEAEIYPDRNIGKEDEVLFPWLDSMLTEEKKNELLARFELSDKNRALDDLKYQRFIERLEQQIK